MIFSRLRGKGGRHERRRSVETAVEAAEGPELPEEPQRPEFGPYDVSQAPNDGTTWVDLGALRVPAIPGVEIQLQAAPDGQIHAVQLSHNGSRLRLGVFAAPRTEGIWDDVRAALRNSLSSAGARPYEVDGDYGVELRAQLKEGSTVTEVRHVGIDGPRWFVHAVYFGDAADPERAGVLRDVVRKLVVDRGPEARPVSEALPLRLPPEAAAQLAAAQARQPAG